jgi:hypothetical protein
MLQDNAQQHCCSTSGSFSQSNDVVHTLRSVALRLVQSTKPSFWQIVPKLWLTNAVGSCGYIYYIVNRRCLVTSWSESFITQWLQLPWPMRISKQWGQWRDQRNILDNQCPLAKTMLPLQLAQQTLGINQPSFMAVPQQSWLLWMQNPDRPFLFPHATPARSFNYFNIRQTIEAGSPNGLLGLTRV